MRPDPGAKDARDTNRDIALRALQERDQARREAREWEQAAFEKRDELRHAEIKLAVISNLHQPDGHACTCGHTHPCPTRRELDR